MMTLMGVMLSAMTSGFAVVLSLRVGLLPPLAELAVSGGDSPLLWAWGLAFLVVSGPVMALMWRWAREMHNDLRAAAPRCHVHLG